MEQVASRALLHAGFLIDILCDKLSSKTCKVLHNLKNTVTTKNLFRLENDNEPFLLLLLLLLLLIIIIIIVVVVIIIALQPFVGPWPLFQFLDPSTLGRTP
jgi:hypothetical protein